MGTDAAAADGLLALRPYARHSERMAMKLDGNTDDDAARERAAAGGTKQDLIHSLTLGRAKVPLAIAGLVGGSRWVGSAVGELRLHSRGSATR